MTSRAPLGRIDAEIIEMYADRAGVGKNSVDRDQCGYRREHRKQCKESDAGRNRHHAVLTDGAIEKPRDLPPCAALFLGVWRRAASGRAGPF